jgi:hypothetical protein
VQERLGSLDFWGSPRGARISIDGQPAGTLPLPSPIRVADGSRSITIEADGFVPQTRTLEVKPGTAMREHIALIAVPVAPPPVATEPKPTDATAPRGGVDLGRGPDGSSPSDTPTDQAPPVYKRWWFWAAAGVVVAAAGVSVYALTRSQGCQATQGGTCVQF